MSESDGESLGRAGTGPDSQIRSLLGERIADNADELIALCRNLVRIPSENPPGDTRRIAEYAAEFLGNIDGAAVEAVVDREPFVNVTARVKGTSGGRRVVFNGHLDTFPAGERSLWAADPFEALVKEGRLYGRGAADMKGGLAASMMAFKLLAELRQDWVGELVLTLAADEETMGEWGSAFLLKTRPYVRGDALICGDAGSPRVIRFGEKGMLWLELTARGRAAHGAHVHLGQNALDLLIQAILKIQSLVQSPVPTPEHVMRAIAQARAVSEPLAGAGETEVLTRVTVNLGTIHGGTSPNLVPAEAKASLDIRLPVGISAEAINKRISDLIGPMANVEVRILARHDPTYSDPSGELFECLVRNGAEATGVRPVVNMRVGASDTRLFRAQGIPSAVYGCTPHNMGGPNEFVTLEDLQIVFRVHALTAFDFLQSAAGR
ncbi:MAG: M20/M25/M40 family metallo-hydrolase [Xanthobacteraceae bacterium]